MVNVRMYTVCLAIVVCYTVDLLRISAQTTMTKYVAEIDTKYVRNGFRSVIVDGIPDCVLICESEEGCMSGSYSGELRVCHLNAGNDVKTSAAGWISFMRNLAPCALANSDQKLQRPLLEGETPTQHPTQSTTTPTIPAEVSIHSTEVNGTFSYPFVSSEQNWTSSESSCQQLGGHLADIQSAEEQAWLFEKAFEKFGSGRYWIGLNDRAVEGTLVWSSSAPTNYDGWMVMYSANEGDDCVAMADYTFNGEWYLHPCNETYPSICKIRS